MRRTSNREFLRGRLLSGKVLGGKLPRLGLFAWLGVGCFICGAGFLALILSKSLVFYVAPSEVVAGTARAGVVGGRAIRLGGLVVADSVKTTTDGVIFAVADLPSRSTSPTNRTTNLAVVAPSATTLTVRYAGVLPPLFAEGEEVIVEGRLEHKATQKIFIADSVFSRHDEEYRPVSRTTPRQSLYQKPYQTPEKQNP